MSGSGQVAGSPAVEESWIEQGVDRLLGKRGTPEDALQRRFLIGCDVIGLAAVVFSLGQGLLRDEWLGSVIIGAFGGCLLVLVGLLRSAVALGKVVWAHFLVLSAFFFFVSVQTDVLMPEQLAWLVLLPLCAVATNRSSSAAGLSFTVPVATALAAALGLAIVGAHELGWTFHQRVERSHWGDLADWLPLLFAASAMVWLFDRLLRRAEAELRDLRVLLSVCAWCHKIHDRGNWVPVSRYMRDQGTPVTHSICPSCTAKHHLDA